MNDNEYLLVGSEELSREFNSLAEIYSDVHKDAYGMRPRDMALCACDYPDHQSLVEAMSHLKRRFDGVVAAAEAEVMREKEEAARMVVEFEAMIATNIKFGAADRAQALAWICDLYGVDNAPGFYGWESLEYSLAIPFGYVEKSMKVTN